MADQDALAKVEEKIAKLEKKVEAIEALPSDHAKQATLPAVEQQLAMLREKEVLLMRQGGQTSLSPGMLQPMPLLPGQHLQAALLDKLA